MAQAGRAGILVPVANPVGVPPLLAIAASATALDHPPPRVLALVPRAGAGAINTDTQEGPSSSPALTAASDYASQHGIAIGTQGMWSDDPAADIIASAHAANAEWIMLGYHRTPGGTDTMGGMVQEVFDRARKTPISVAVFIQGTEHPSERVFTAVDNGADGRAALELAVRIAQKDKRRLRALLISKPRTIVEDELADMVKLARERLGRNLHADVLTKRNLTQLFRQSPGRLLIVAKTFADEVGLPLDEVPEGGRCVIVVQGAEK
jgi:hypothetical protein